MKIYIDTGQEHVLIKRMLPIWNQMGHVISKPAEADALLCNIRIANKKLNLPKAQRLDGIYYDADTDYNSRNSAISATHAIVDGTINQSYSCKEQAEKYLAKRKKSAKWTVIYNGIKENWCGEHEHTNDFHIVVAAKWRRHKRLKETIDIFLKFLKKFPNSYLHIMGNIIQNQVVQNKNIIYYGHLSHKQMAIIYRKCDCSIHLSKRDACPNSVVESIGAGIPVITSTVCGGSTEMCKMTKGCVIVDGDTDLDDYAPAYPYRNHHNIVSKELTKNIINQLQNIYENRTRVKIPKILTIEHCAESYINFLKVI
jgi:glycosyltransferase involved in cell wall biosynthesis